MKPSTTPILQIQAAQAAPQPALFAKLPAKNAGLLTFINILFIVPRVIKSFACRETARLFRREPPRRFPAEIQVRALMRLAQIDAAMRIEDLRLPPSNRLERLKGNRKGQWSIRINDQWRVCFRFEDGDAFDVEVTDYH